MKLLCLITPRFVKDLLKLVIFNCRLFYNNHREKTDLMSYKLNQYSQNGEDGIIEEIFKRLEIKEGWVVEFGAWDGKYCSNTYRLLKKGFKAVYIEGDKEKYKELEKLDRNIITINTYVAVDGKNSLDNILKQTELPKNFELLSIDVDGIDYYIWEKFEWYKPKVVIIEVNSGTPKPPHEMTRKLGTKKGYTEVCNVGNILFVRNDLVYLI